MSEEATTRAARLPGDLDVDFEEFRDVNDMSNSEALRELVRTGIEQKRKHPLDDRPDTLLGGLLWDARRDIHTFVLISVMSLVVFTLASGPLSWGAGLLASLYALTVVVGAIDALFLDRGLTLRLAGYGADSADEVAQ